MSTGKSDVKSVLKLTRLFKAPRERVFQAWTNPGEIREWWNLGEGWTVTIAEVDLRAGGRFRIGVRSAQNKAVHEVKGTYREVIPAKKLVYTWVVEDPAVGDAETLVTVEFITRGRHTELALTHERLSEKSLHGTVEEGWKLVLGGLQRFLQ